MSLSSSSTTTQHQQQQQQQTATLEQQPEADRKPNVGKNLVIGAVARCTAGTIMYPVDMIKTRLQFQRGGNGVEGNYRSPMHALRTIVKQEGVFALYRGLPVKLMYIAPAAAVSFTVYENMKSAVDSIKKNNHTSTTTTVMTWVAPVASFALFAGARVCGSLMRTPFDILKQQLQIEGLAAVKSKGGIFNTIQYIFKAEGFRGFFSGLGITLLRDIPFASLYFTSYEVTKRFQQRIAKQIIINQQQQQEQQAATAVDAANIEAHNNNNNNTTTTTTTSSLAQYYARHQTLIHLSSGAIAGGFATTCTIPIDVIKTRLQTQNRLRHSSTGVMKKYHGIVDAFVTVYKEEGLAAFRRGLTPRLMYIMPSSALTFAIYEFLKMSPLFGASSSSSS